MSVFGVFNNFIHYRISKKNPTIYKTWNLFIGIYAPENISEHPFEMKN